MNRVEIWDKSGLEAEEDVDKTAAGLYKTMSELGISF